ncbi:hypothetical protein [Pantanalinema sp. GBBB05]|uniref:hypothetical protein n=1 Tax=Pantanalinema sp. GBBB05 TaxID=2604139 RepID=UPI001D77FB74|nr:hypothetical protein [Pantanalinema sp. GBBB05]
MRYSLPEFSDTQLQMICETADVITCECPAHLVELLRKVRRFRRYTASCADLSPEEAETHRWLADQTSRVEKLLSQILFEFMQREELLDEQSQLNLEKLAHRNRSAALREQAYSA